MKIHYRYKDLRLLLLPSKERKQCISDVTSRKDLTIIYFRASSNQVVSPSVAPPLTLLVCRRLKWCIRWFAASTRSTPKSCRGEKKTTMYSIFSLMFGPSTTACRERERRHSWKNRISTRCTYPLRQHVSLKSKEERRKRRKKVAVDTHTHTPGKCNCIPCILNCIKLVIERRRGKKLEDRRSLFFLVVNARSNVRLSLRSAIVFDCIISFSAAIWTLPPCPIGNKMSIKKEQYWYRACPARSSVSAEDNIELSRG